MTKEELKQYREKIGMTQAQFATWLGLNREKTISDYEHGRRNIPGWLIARINSEKNKNKV